MHDDTKEITERTLVSLLFGMPYEDVIRDIRQNKDGKYEHLYVKEEEKRK